MLNSPHELTKNLAAQKAVPLDEHRAWADLCRSIAIYGVVLIHSCGATFYRYGKIPLGDWLSANSLDSLARCTVPLFVMLSGALILCRTASGDYYHGGGAFFSKLRQRIIRVFMPLLVWSGIYLMYVSHHISLQVNWLSILSQPAMYHLWFVYMIIGIYLFIPIFQILFEAIHSRFDLQVYLFTLWFIITCVPVYQPLPVLSLLQQNSFFGYGGYFLIGGVIASAGRNRHATFVWFLLFLSSALVTFGITWYLSWQAHAPVEKGYLYFSPNVLISSISAFVLFTRATLSVSMAKSMKWVSERSFFVFFVHVLVLEYVRYSNTIYVVGQHLPMLITILLISIATFTLCLVISSFVRLVPGAQRVFG